MKKRKENYFYLITAIVIFAASSVNIVSCKDTFSSLIPNNEQKIIRLNLKNTEKRVCSTGCEVKGQHITVKVPVGTDVTNLLPEAVISEQATLFPITLRYLQEAFPATDILQLAKYSSNPHDIGALDKWFLSLYSDNPDFNIPPIVFAINFLSPVSFAVIGGRGGFEMYTVKVMYEDGTDPGTGLLPPGVVAEKNILTFTVPEHQTGTSVISEEKIDFKVKAETEVRSLLPVITASEGAVVLPVTQEYIKRFCDENGLDYLNVLSGFITAPDKRGYLRALIAPLDISRIRVSIDKPIDFTDSVYFAVLGKDKDVKLYTATCKKDSGEAYLENFAITKFKNPALITDGKIEINRNTNEIKATLFYPVEYTQGVTDAFSLFCEAVFIGDSAELEYKGVKYNLTEGKIPFTPENPQGQYSLGSAKADLHIKNAGVTTSYKVNLIFKEDPDTVRSITDFRFEKFYNDGIKNTAMAAISNDGHEGTISVTVLYGTAEKPETLVPSFISAGKVTVNGAVQHSAVDAQDFRAVKVYLCTSKNGQYTRRYTVKVKFIKVETAQPMLKSFKFPYSLNGKLSNDAIGRIDELTNSVYVNVQYSSQEVPEVLIPEFSATGDVTVNGLIQSSGFSSQNFKYTVYYKVSEPSDPSVSKTYGVHAAFTFAHDSGCELLSFSLLAADNPSLKADIEVPISKYSNNLYAAVPKNAEITNLIPSFTAKGKVSVDGIEQTSGVSAVDFSAPIEYTVTSENGLYTKRYIVKLQKAGDIIYVNTGAAGRNNGLTWEDAFIRLDTALEKAESLAQDTIPEIWITKDSILTGAFKINRQLVLRGGFGGTEISQDQRNKENRTLFSGSTFSSDKEISGKLIFDSLQFKVNAQPVQEIKWAASQDNSLEIKNTSFTGGAKLDIESNLALLKIADSEFDGNGGNGSISTKADFTGGIEISNSEFSCPVVLNTSNTVNAENCKFRAYPITANAENISVTQAEIEKNCTLSAAKNLTLTQIKIENTCALSAAKNFMLTELRSYYAPINVTAADESTVTIESSNMKELILKNGTADIKKLNAVTIKNSFIGELTAENKIITGKLSCSGKYADYTNFGITGNNLTLPACQTEITNASFKGNINTFCTEEDFGSVITGISLDTTINTVQADTLKCGVIKSNQKEDLKSNIRTDEYKYKMYTDISKGGVQTITSCTFKQCFVFSGDKINFSNNTIIGNREKFKIINNRACINPAEAEDNFESEYIKNKGIPVLQFVILKNSATADSNVSVSNITSSCGWFRAETNTLKVGVQSLNTIGGGNAVQKGVSGFSRAEFYGYSSLNVQNSDFTNILPFNGYLCTSYFSCIPVAKESFTAAGGEVKVTKNTFTCEEPVLIGVLKDFDISGNKFDIASGVLGTANNNGGLELTLLYPGEKTIQPRYSSKENQNPLSHINLTAEHEFLNDILKPHVETNQIDNGVIKTAGTITIKDYTKDDKLNGIAINREKVVVENCAFGNGISFIRGVSEYSALEFYGKVGVTLDSLDIEYDKAAKFKKNDPESFLLIDGQYCTGSITVKNCKFSELKGKAIQIGNNYRNTENIKPFNIIFSGTTFTAAEEASDIILSGLKTLTVNSCTFNTANLYISNYDSNKDLTAVDTDLYGKKEIKDCTFYDSKIILSPAKNLSTEETFRPSRIHLINCDFKNFSEEPIEVNNYESDTAFGPAIILLDYKKLPDGIKKYIKKSKYKDNIPNLSETIDALECTNDDNEHGITGMGRHGCKVTDFFAKEIPIGNKQKKFGELFGNHFFRFYGNGLKAAAVFINFPSKCLISAEAKNDRWYKIIGTVAPLPQP